MNFVDPYGLAEYLVVWDMSSATWDFGALNLKGFVIDPKPIRNKTDGKVIGYNALDIRGAFVGGSISFPPISFSTTNVALFEDNLPKPNLYNVEGDSLISNCPGSKTHFGELILKRMIKT